MNIITIMVHHEGRRKPEAREVPMMPVGIFAVHRPVEPYYVKYWAISHIASGLRVGIARKRRDAKLAAQTLLALDVTWHSDHKQFSISDRETILRAVAQLRRDGVLIPQ